MSFSVSMQYCVRMIECGVLYCVSMMCVRWSVMEYHVHMMNCDGVLSKYDGVRCSIV